MSVTTIDRPEVGETNGLVDGRGYHAARGSCRRVDWTAKGLRITRLRLLSDRGFPAYDVSYCHGRLGAEDVDVEVPFSQLPKGGLTRAIVEHAKRDNVFARGIGVLEAISILN